ncbi:hypothetical protein GLOTRDRAFT_134081 [Gloeophyllum trabeum ATCC 11539]|uniref:Uncharacterized protein n=1 Tax=Gloeophyllum trabeum (strain ATCC 11539 / FP-39264 / Madison 617) TaxID=670483 RepID=S7PS96_GLOTA|nr:uncharacterized protein GLOTRDRAFT_134081 [Gloeophyllum trabeum ATCC 11539]EPQ50273.1 hypothetical protein GLOTRDRAFT_134081 [Gloeophyllum trabeum ATCC 11539]
MELDIAGMVDGAPSDVTTAQRLERLQKHTDAWRRRAFETVEELPCHEAHMVQLSGKVLARCIGNSTLAFNLLPGHARGVPAKEWRFENVGFPIAEYAVDPAQDLVVILSGLSGAAGGAVPLSQAPMIYLWSLSTGVPHPLAAETELVFPPGLVYDMERRFKLFLTGDILGVEFRASDGGPCKHLIAWSWKSGTMCLWINGDCLLLAPSQTTGCAPRIFANVIDTRRVYSHPVSWGGDEYCCAFEYPFYEHRYLSWKIQWLSSSSERADEGLFHSLPSDECVVVEMSYGKIGFPAPEEDVDDGHGEHHLNLTHIIPATVILSRIQKHTISHPDSQKVWRWEEWGAARTFMTGPFQSFGRAFCRQSISAYRFIEWPIPVYPAEPREGLARNMAELYDFNTWRFRRAPREDGLELHAVTTRDKGLWINHAQFLECAKVDFRLPPLMTRYKGYQWDLAISEDNVVLFYDNYPHTECYVMSI